MTSGDELSAAEAYNEGARLETADFTRYFWPKDCFPE